MSSRAALVAVVVAALGITPAVAAPPPGGPPVVVDPLAGAPRAPIRPAWIGVVMAPGGPAGVEVKKVIRSSPADKAGLAVGDHIVSVDGHRVTRAEEVSRAVGGTPVGGAVALVLSRAGKTKPVRLVVAGRPSVDDMMRMDLVGAFAPPWVRVTPLAGAPSSVASLKGQVVLVDFFAGWCGPCKLLAPKLSALSDRYRAQGLRVVGMTTDGPEEAATFSERHGMRYPVVIDTNAETSQRYGVSALPTMLLIDKRGVVREVFVGYDPGAHARLDALVQSLLAEPAPGKGDAGP
ncbi:MAG: redoxin domain-containing protein [Myxococcales bacterium]|nr:redoxin domain-containing protein [Myxococcales bacterium]